MVQEATKPLPTCLFSTEKVPESHFPSKSTVSIHTPVRLGQGYAQDQAGPGERSEVQGAAATFGGTLREPGITTSGKGITVEGAAATFSAPLQEP